MACVGCRGTRCAAAAKRSALKRVSDGRPQQEIMRTPVVIALLMLMLPLLLLLSGSASAGNPLLVPSRGLADPHVRVLGDRIYMFATHDFSHNNTDFLMCDWWVWTTHDLVRRPLPRSLSPCVPAL